MSPAFDHWSGVPGDGELGTAMWQGLLARLAGNRLVALREAPRATRLLEPGVFDYAPNYVSPLPPGPSSVTLGHSDAVDESQHGLGQLGETDGGGIGDLSLVTYRMLPVPADIGLDRVEDVGGEGHRFVELDAEVGQHVGVQGFKHGHAADEGQQSGAFVLGHVILHRLRRAIRALFRGRVE